MDESLRTVIDHLRAIRERADEASRAKDIEGLRAAIGDYHKVSTSTSETFGESIPVDADGVRAAWITTTDSDPNRRVLYIHGGSWIGGGIEEYRPLTSRIAAASGYAVLLIEYRLAPENPFPAALDDCITAYEWMRHHGPSVEESTNCTCIVGDSAGGNLTLATLLGLRDRGLQLPDAAVAISPATDLTGSGESVVTRAKSDPIIEGARVSSTARVYTKDRDLTEPLVSPLFGDLSGLPRLLIQVGDAETLLDDSRRFAAKAQAAGVDATLEVWPEMPHVWHVFAPYLRQSVNAIERIGGFLNAR